MNSEEIAIAQTNPPAVPDPTLPAGNAVPFTTAHFKGPYTESQYDYRYVNETGHDVLPTSTGTGVKVRIHGGLSELHVYWTVERMFETPELPKLETTDSNLVPIRQEFTPASMYQSANGPIYRVSGVNRYKMLTAKLAVDPVAGTGATPDPVYYVAATPELFDSFDIYYVSADFTRELV